MSLNPDPYNNNSDNNKTAECSSLTGLGRMQKAMQSSAGSYICCKGEWIQIQYALKTLIKYAKAQVTMLN